jgi:hypothetical protein
VAREGLCAGGDQANGGRAGVQAKGGHAGGEARSFASGQERSIPCGQAKIHSPFPLSVAPLESPPPPPTSSWLPEYGGSVGGRYVTIKSMVISVDYAMVVRSRFILFGTRTICYIMLFPLAFYSTRL